MPEADASLRAAWDPGYIDISGADARWRAIPCFTSTSIDFE
jgi:hypothetical protein